MNSEHQSAPEMAQQDSDEVRARAGVAADSLVGLPVWVSTATPEQAAERDHWREQQESHIDEQIADGFPTQHIKVRCGCWRYESWRVMTRCLYCGVWLCPTCAQQHFGYRLPD